MAVAYGVNAGFVTTAPVDDPAGTNTPVDEYATVVGDTSPAGVTKITEVGWWCDSATEEANFEVGLYAADGAVVPGEAGTLLHVSRVHAKGTGAGWKRATVDWAIDSSTDYWIAFQLDDTATLTRTNYSATDAKNDQLTGVSTLPDPFGSGSYGTFLLMAVYALVEVAPPVYVPRPTVAVGNPLMFQVLSLSAVITPIYRRKPRLHHFRL